MTGSEQIWVWGMLGLLMVTLFAFRRMRSQTNEFKQMRIVKKRLPNWAVLFEKLVWLAFLVLMVVFVSSIFGLFHRLTYPGQAVQNATAVFAVTGTMLIAGPTSMLLANGVSWLFPQLRAANIMAMAGTDVSFTSSNQGLLRFCAVFLPVGIIDIALAAAEPWAH
jgi:hypothetical protein